jgi:hypothetical protein
MTDLLNTSKEYKLFMRITPNQHEKNEWSRLAQAAYSIGRNDLGHTYSVAASLPRDGWIRLSYFDVLQKHYRVWLIDNEFPAVFE